MVQRYQAETRNLHNIIFLLKEPILKARDVSGWPNICHPREDVARSASCSKLSLRYIFHVTSRTFQTMSDTQLYVYQHEQIGSSREPTRMQRVSLDRGEIRVMTFEVTRKRLTSLANWKIKSSDRCVLRESRSSCRRSILLQRLLNSLQKGPELGSSPCKMN